MLWVETAGRSLLLGGDVEAVAQRELPSLMPDVLLVPHHGSATSDIAWLTNTVGSVVVVSVGANTYGHPDLVVIDALRTTGARVFLTQEVGEVVIPLE